MEILVYEDYYLGYHWWWWWWWYSVAQSCSTLCGPESSKCSEVGI